MIKKKELSYEFIIVILFSILPIIDSINGILIEKQMTSIGTLYKVFVIGVLLILGISDGKMIRKQWGIIFVIIGYVLMTILTNSIVSNYSIISVDFPVKLIFNAVMFVLLVQNITKKHISADSIYKILNNNTYIIIICVLVPYALNIGNAIYAGNIGYKAFYYSQNELNASLIVLFFFSLYKLYNKITIQALFQVCGVLICVLLMSTKSSLMACAIGIFIYLIDYIRKENSRRKVVIIIAGIIAILISGGFVISKIADMFTRQSSLFNMYDGSLIATLTSGRTYFLEDAFSEFIESDLFIERLLIGNGFCSNNLIEMDFFDIFFYLGIVGVTGVIIFAMYVIMKSKKNMRSEKCLIRKTGFIVMLAFSFFTGHVLFMATSGCYFVLLCVFNMTYADKREVNYEYRS